MVSEFSTKSMDEADIFTDQEIVGVAEAEEWIKKAVQFGIGNIGRANNEKKSTTKE